MLSKSLAAYQGEFIFELEYGLYNFGGNKQDIENTNNIFSFQTSTKYNNKSIAVGTATEFNNNIYLFAVRNALGYSNDILYALEIYNRDLTDEEISVVKTRMIKTYEEKTGNKYIEVS